MNYFSLAAALARTERDSTLERITCKAAAIHAYALRQPGVCGCSAYPFLHRAGQGQCPALQEAA